MSQENVEVVRHLYESGMFDRDPEELLELATPSHEHLARASHLPVSIAQRPATG